MGDEQDARVVFEPAAQGGRAARRVAGEMANVSHAALHGYGLRVAFFAWTREEKTPQEAREGYTEVYYRLLTVLSGPPPAWPSAWRSCAAPSSAGAR